MRTRDRDDPIPDDEMDALERVSVEVVSRFMAFRFVRSSGIAVVRSRHAMRNFPLRNEHRMQNLRRSSLSDGGASASRGLPGTPKNQRRLSVRGGTLEGERMRFRFVMMIRATMGVG